MGSGVNWCPDEGETNTTADARLHVRLCGAEVIFSEARGRGSMMASGHRFRVEPEVFRPPPHALLCAFTFQVHQR